jgi:RNA polymerase sigma factor (sigma-70 family)
MIHQSLKQDNHQIDRVLLPYLEAKDESDSQELAERLIVEEAGPTIQGIIKYKLTVMLDRVTWTCDSQDAEDVYGDVILELLAWLRKFKANPENNTIRNFSGFVASLAYRACATYMRKKHPKRLSLKNKIYYTLTHHRDFALWKNLDDEWLCGLSGWRDHKMFAPTSRLRLLRDDPRAFEQAALPYCDVGHLGPKDMLAAIFNWVETPVKLDDVVSTIAELWGIRDGKVETHTCKGGQGNQYGRLQAAQGDTNTEVEQRIHLRRIWAEINRLSPRQRRALLLNLTDWPGDGVIALLLVTRIACFQEIAEALDMTADQLDELWNSLPLDDAAIAARLGVTRQQVINLRKAARRRLVRRMKTAGS